MGELARLRKEKKLCKICDSPYHYRSWCPQKPHKPLKRTAIKKTGKHATQWKKTRTAWLKANKRNSYQCYLCQRLLTPNQMQLDHVQSRARRPDLRYEMSNLQPICAPCNRSKGSLSVEQYRELQSELRGA